MWTHRYKYKMKSPRYIERVGYDMTGSVQTSRPMADREVELLAKEMSHGKINDAEMLSCRLVETR